MTSVAAAPSGTPSPAAGQPDVAGVVGGADGEVAESLGLALVLGLGEPVSVEEGAAVGEAEVEDASVVGEELSLPPEQPARRSEVAASVARLSERVRRGDAWVLITLV
jgi:hypothetical protein